MTITLDPGFDKGRAKTVTLAGSSYYIAPLPLRQILALADLLPKLKNINPEKVTSEMFDPVIEIVQRALLRAYPGITKDDLLDLPITALELLAAVPVIVEQGGGQASSEPAAGEAVAASPLNPSTGADSSPTL